MRIDAYNQVNQLYKATNIKNIKKSNSDYRSDKVELSTQGADYQLVKKVMAETPDVREDLVSNLKSRIDAGQYQVSAEDFAEKIISNYKQKR